MTKLTKTQLVDENIRLRAHCDVIERQRAEAVEALHRLRDEVLASRMAQQSQPQPVKTWRDDHGAMWGKYYLNGGRVATLRRI